MNHILMARKIIQATSDRFACETAEIKSKSRPARIVTARQLAMYLIRQETNLTLAQVGNEIGGRTPATISWGYQQVASKLNKQDSLKRAIEQIKRSLTE